MFRFRMATLATAWVIVGLGCTDVSEPPDVPPVSRAVAALEREELSTLQREWSKYAKEAPGFAGMFVDDQGNLVVRTVDMSEQEVLRQAVQPIVQQYQSMDAGVSGTRVQPADYSFAQLVRWHNAIRRDLRGTTGWASIFVDYMANQIGIGFAPEHEAGMRSAGLAAARDHGVPEDAVTFYPFEVVPDIGRGTAPAATLRNHTLEDAHDPLIGGTRVVAETFHPFGGCTMTLNVRWSYENPNQPMWLTNAHCSQRIGTTETDAWFQPTASFGIIGYNAVDRLFSGGEGGRHGYADATMQYKHTWQQDRGTAIGRIAATLGYPFPYEVPESGSLTIDHSFTRKVTGQFVPISGVQVFKTGITTGTTTGRVFATDLTTIRCRVGGEEEIGCPSGRWEMREQYTARYWSFPGDSGSPVWRPNDTGAGKTVWIVGQHWGRTSRDSTASSAIFSRWSQVAHMVEFGNSPICYTVSCQ